MKTGEWGEENILKNIQRRPLAFALQRGGISKQSTITECLSLRLHYLPPPPPLPQANVCSPTWILRGDTVACGGGGEGSQFRRPARGLRHSVYSVSLLVLDSRSIIRNSSQGFERIGKRVVIDSSGGRPPPASPP
jgi:hypothetical protein